MSCSCATRTSRPGPSWPGPRRQPRCAPSFGVPFILNDRPDLALACAADGVHVGQDDTPPEVARRILGPEAIIGFSTHSPAEWDAARGSTADYLSAGPVIPTPTKPGRPGTGLEYLTYAAGSTEARPWFVTGGVTPDAVPALARAGARRFVVVRYLTTATDPESAARRPSGRRRHRPPAVNLPGGPATR